ncbi:MAG: acyltransferase [bacterium]|nr:acyltransferase [bacterium]
MNIFTQLVAKVVNRFRYPEKLDALKARGLVVGSNFHMMDEVVLDRSHCWHIVIGDDVTLAPRVRILCHDASTKNRLGYTLVGKVSIGSRVFIGASAIVMPGVNIGDDVIIGSGSIVTRDVPSNSVAVGNPARIICTCTDFMMKREADMEKYPRFGAEYTLAGGVTPEMRNEMNRLMVDRFGFIE